MKFKNRIACMVFLVLFAVLSLSADVTVVFNEVMYHPDELNEASFEWVELYNQLAVDMDISGWSIDNGVDFTFPEGTVIQGGGYLVVAASPGDLTTATGVTNVLGPFSGRLSNGGEKLKLLNNNRRLMDELDYGTEGAWPVAPDGGGPSLAKLNEDGASADPGNWQASLWQGGSPGLANSPDITVTVDPDAVEIDSVWRFHVDGTDPGAAWKSPGYDDSLWNSGRGIFASSASAGWVGETQSIVTLFSSGMDATGQVLSPGATDPHYTLTASAYSTPPPPDINATVMQNHPAWLANSALSSWIGVVPGGTTGVPAGDYNFRTTFDLSTMDPDTAEIQLRVSADDRLNNVLMNGVDQGISFVGFNAFSPVYTISSGFTDGVNTLDFYTANDSTSANPSGFRVEAAGTAVAVLTPNTVLTADKETKYFRTTFVIDGDPSGTSLAMQTILDDGAVYYLNGSEVLRLNMPAGTISHTSRALANVVTAELSAPYQLSTESLVAGTNVLAVEVHQAPTGSGDIVFGAELEVSLTNNLPPRVPALAFNELSSATDSPFLVEIMNYGSQALSLTNYVFRRFGSPESEYVLPVIELPAGERAVINPLDFGFVISPGDRLVLYTPDKAAVVDAVVTKNYPQARWPESTGPWLHPESATFGTTNCVSLQSDIVINEIMYHPRDPQGADVNSPEQWIELYNRGSGGVDLEGWRLEIDSKTAFRFPAGSIIAPDSYLVVALDADYLSNLYPSIAITGNLDKRLPGSGGKIELFDAAALPLHPDADPDDSGNPADLVCYGDRSPWPAYADGLGATLELRDPRSDNDCPESWMASNDSSKSTWQSYVYSGTAASEAANCPTLWKEFVLGLISEGEILLDDLSVVEDPSGTATELIQNGSFESGLDTWRIIGNHRRSEVVTDPDNAANHVLQLRSSGYTGHMHNHAETTLANGASIVNGRQYRISFRAKWVAGCNRLLSRLYFNRLPALTEISQPSLVGTPGAQNSCYTPNIGPTFKNLSHSPVVPVAGQGVEISVTASDPDGVSSAALHYAVDSGSWQSVPASIDVAGDGSVRVTASVPGQSSGSIVQFYFETADSLGAESFAPDAGVNSRALYEVNGSAAIMPQLHSVRLVMTPADASFLHSSVNVMSNERMGCTLITDEKTVAYDCGLHLQGSERGRDNSDRVGFNVRMPYDHPYRGVLGSITIDRSGGQSGRGGDHDEILLKHAINKAGGLPGMYDDLCQVFAPRPQEDGTGLLILAKYGKEFLNSQYKEGSDGELFKLELIYYPTNTLTGDPQSYKLPQPDSVKGTDLKDLGDDPEAYRWTFLKENRTDRNYYAPMVELAKAFSLSGDALETRMQELMDVDEWMRGVAFIGLIGGSDIYTSGNSHNAIFYFRPEDGRAMLFPWDMDFSFVQSTSTGFPGTASPNTLKLINLPNNLHAYYGHLYDLSSVTGDSEYMGEWADRYAGLLGEDWSADVTYLKNRADYVRSHLPTAVPFEITSNLGGDFSVAGSPVTIAGNGSITVKCITVNGITYPVDWTSATEWNITLPLPEITNRIDLQAFGLHGELLAGSEDTITIINLGSLAPQPVLFNEWMADNSAPAGYPDPADQKFHDWFELYNPNDTPVDLSGYTLTDNLEKPDKSTIPSNTVIAAHGFLLVWADGDESQSGGDLHASFKLSAGGESLGLYSPEGVRQHALTFGEQAENVSQGFYPDGNIGPVYDMTDWTPLGYNRIDGPAKPDIVVFHTSLGSIVTIDALTEPDRTYVIEYKNDLNDPEWMPLCTNRASTGVSSFIDASPGVTKRFYRAVLLQ